MSAEGRALLLRTRSSSKVPSPIVFDVLATLEHDMQEALKGKAVALMDWTNWLKKGEPNREAFIQAVFLLVAMSGLSSRDVAKLRRELMNVSPSRRRKAKILSGPAERTTRGLF